MVNLGRNEHRLLGFVDDFRGIGSELYIPQEDHIKPPLQLVGHPDTPSTLTYYVTLEDSDGSWLGLPNVKIKPRSRSTEDTIHDLAIGSSTPFCDEDTIQQVELKFDTDYDASGGNGRSEKFFADMPTLEAIIADPVLHLVSQPNALLKDPAFKAKEKVYGFKNDPIPIGILLKAINNLPNASKLLGKYNGGENFAEKLEKVMENLSGYQFNFGLVSQYTRDDCIPRGGNPEKEERLRATFDACTGLYFVRTRGWSNEHNEERMIELIEREKGVRFELKVDFKKLKGRLEEKLGEHIRMVRTEFLMPRILSKSQTAVTLLSDERERSLAVIRDAYSGREVFAVVPIPFDKFSDIRMRKKLKRDFSHGGYRIHQFNPHFNERHLVLSKGSTRTTDYSLNRMYLSVTPKPDVHSNHVGGIEYRLIDAQIPHKGPTLIRRSDYLRERLKNIRLGDLRSELFDEGGYVVVSPNGGCFTVSFGTKKVGKVSAEGMSTQEPENYFSVKYIGRSEDSPLRSEEMVHREMRKIIQYAREKKLI